MCEQIPLHYKQGDVVWVRLGSCWWPGEAYDFENLPEEVQEELCEKKPLVSVKFFKEDSYEYVRNVNQIYSYNCSRKEEFIRKGMDLFRAKNVNLEKFPADIKMAEVLTGGNEDILNDPIYSTPKKAHVSPSKKTPKNKALSSPVSPAVTHPRFIGANDHNVRVRVQSTMEQSTPKPENAFKCTQCGFSSPRVDAIVLHNKMHAWETPTIKSKKGGSKRRPKKNVRVSAAKTRTIDEDLELLEKGYSLTDSELSEESEEEKEENKKKKRKKKKTTSPTKATSAESKKNKTVSAIQGNILAEWDDDDDNETDEVNDSLNSTAASPVVKKDADKPVTSTKEAAKSVAATAKAQNKKETKATTKEKPAANVDIAKFDELDIEAILESTTVPKIPEIPNHKADVGKSKGDEKKPEVATKLTNPKKRFVKSFEDFEQSMKEKAKETTESKENANADKNGDDSAENKKSVDKKVKQERETAAAAAVESKNDTESEEDIPRKITRRSMNRLNKSVVEEKAVAEKAEKVDSKEAKLTDNEDKKVKAEEIKKPEDENASANASKPEVRSYRRKPKESKSTDDEKESTAKSDGESDAKKAETEKKESKIAKNKPAVKQNKPREKILTEIDVFGSIRADEDERYNKKASEESPRRETRASRSKSRTESQESKAKTESAKRKEKPETPTYQKAGKRGPKRADSVSGANTKNAIVADFSEEDTETSANENEDKDEKSQIITSMKSKLKHVLTDSLSDDSPEVTASSPPKRSYKNPRMEVKDTPKRELRSASKPVETVENKAEKLEEVKKVLKSPRSEEKTPTKADIDEKLANLDKSIINSIIMPAADTVSDKVDEVIESKKPVVGARIGSPRKSVAANETPAEEIKEKRALSPKKTDPKLPAEEVKAPKSPQKSDARSPVRAAGSKSPTKASSPAKSPIILNKDAPKASESFSKFVKSPRRISLNSQEVTIERIVDKVEINMNNATADKVKDKVTVEVIHKDDHKESSSSAVNIVPESDKNIKVLTESVLAQGQVEIATIMEDGTPKIASIPSEITIEKCDAKKEAKIAETKLVESEKIESEASADNKKKPIILNTKMKQELEGSTSKLLDILTDNRRPVRSKPSPVPLPKISNPKFEVDDRKQGIVGTTPKQPTTTTTTVKMVTGVPQRKPTTILSDTVIKAGVPGSSVVSVQKVIKRSHGDVEDVDRFIISKHPKKDSTPEVKTKPKILDHRIITATGQVIQPKQYGAKKVPVKVPTTKTVEERVYDLLNSPKSSHKEGGDDTFDIDNMPIVLSDQILTADNISNMPIVIQESPTNAKKQPQQLQIVSKQQASTSTVVGTRGTPTAIVKRPAATQKLVKGQRIYQTVAASSAMIKQSPTIITQANKPGKYIIVPSQSTTPTGTKYTVGKRQVLKKATAAGIGNVKVHQAAQNVASSAPTGNKIMIVTNHQGQQSRVLLTPEQQRLMGYGTRKIIKSSPILQTKTAAGKIVQQNVVQSQISAGPGLTVVKKKVDPSKQRIIGQKIIGGTLQQTKAIPQTRTIIIKNPQGQTVKIQGTDEAALEKQVAEQLEAINRAANARNIAQASAMGQKQVQQQVVKRTAAIKKQVASPAPALSEGTKLAIQNKTVGRANAVPPLAPISPQKKAAELAVQQQQQQQQLQQQMKQKVVQTASSRNQVSKAQSVLQTSTTTPQTAAAVTPKAAAVETAVPSAVEAKKEPEKQPKQLVIQDAMGNETTIVEGQILALPSETLDGQPQSYMLVTLDETGNLTPLNNEALMSLDLNLNLGGDLSNMVVQIDQGEASSPTTASTNAVESSAEPATTIPTVETKVVPATPTAATSSVAAAAAEEQVQMEVAVPAAAATTVSSVEATPALAAATAAVAAAQEQVVTTQETQEIQAVSCSINKGDTQQQLYITGDPVATQKFLESLSEGNPDLTNILANAEGNILIHADGQQILINTDADNQILMSMGATAAAVAAGGSETPEAANPLFMSQPASKNQDILAAALADTDVFQQDQSLVATTSKVAQPAQLSPGYPLSVNNVLETSAMNSPIMTTQEMPRAIAKKSESDILTEVPKNVDLPITITDPNIAQSVANQPSSLLATELPASLEIPLSIQEVATTVSTEMSSPGFSYSLPSLEDPEKFNSPISMPLLTEDPEETAVSTAAAAAVSAAEGVISGEVAATAADSDSKEAADSKDTTNGAINNEDLNAKSQSSQEVGSEEYLLASSEMCSISNQISSLSEPPQDMFEFTMESNYEPAKLSSEDDGKEEDGAEVVAAETASSKSPKRNLEEEETTEEKEGKRAKLD